MRPPGVNDNGSRFPRKSNPVQKCIYIFLILIAQGSITEEDTIMSKVAKGKGKGKGKGKTHSKNGKTAKCAEQQDN